MNAWRRCRILCRSQSKNKLRKNYFWRERERENVSHKWLMDTRPKYFFKGFFIFAPSKMLTKFSTKTHLYNDENVTFSRQASQLHTQWPNGHKNVAFLSACKWASTQLPICRFISGQSDKNGIILICDSRLTEIWPRIRYDVHTKVMQWFSD